MITHNLYAIPETRRFGVDDEATLARELADLERATNIRHIGGVGELCLDHDGLLPNGYRYTASAFKQVCAIASRGLHALVLDLAGMAGGVGVRSDYSPAGAVELFNTVIRRRYRGRFDGRTRVVRNTTRKVIDGVLGPKYNYLENHAVYAMAKDATVSGAMGARFHEAALTGRRFMLRYAGHKPLFKLDDDSFYGGFHFSNSEVAGEASVRATTLLLHQPSGTASLGRYGAGRLAHAGKDFGAKLNKMFQAVLTQPQDAAWLRRCVESSRASSLGLGGTDQEREAQVDYLTLVLRRQEIPKALARKIVISTMVCGGHGVPGRPRVPTREMTASRTVYDFYSALTRESRELPLGTREAAEQAAFGLLTGKIKLR